MNADPLSSEHRQKLEQASGITPEVISDRGYRTITLKKELEPLGFSPAQRRVSGLLIPLHGPDGTAAGYQYRLDYPRTDKRGRPIKYETPAGGNRRGSSTMVCVSSWRSG